MDDLKKNSGLVQFRYALGDNGQIIDAFNLTDDSKGENVFICAGCGGKCHVALYRRRNRSHFRHLSDKTGICNKETYLHKTAKFLFYDEYRKCKDEKIPFTVGIAKQLLCGKTTGKASSVCHRVKGYSIYDLTQYYDYIHPPETKYVKEYKPDVVIERSSRGDLLGIEIYHTNKVTLKKRIVA